MFGIPTIKLVMYGIAAIAAMVVIAMIYTAIGNHFTAPLKLELKAAQQATETATNANQTLQRDLAVLKEQLSVQSKAFDEIKSQSDGRIAASQAALAQAKAKSAALDSTVASLKVIAASKGNDNGCVAVDKLLTDLATDRVRYNGTAGVTGPGISSQGSSSGSLRIR